MWIIMKSAGDDFSFTSFYIEGKTGHSLEYAHSLAKEVTLAMKEYKMNRLKTDNECICSPYVLENFGCKCREDE
jgi:hypothetical protein